MNLLGCKGRPGKQNLAFVGLLMRSRTPADGSASFWKNEVLGLSQHLEFWETRKGGQLVPAENGLHMLLCLAVWDEEKGWELNCSDIAVEEKELAVPAPSMRTTEVAASGACLLHFSSYSPDFKMKRVWVRRRSMKDTQAHLPIFECCYSFCLLPLKMISNKYGKTLGIQL